MTYKQALGHFRTQVNLAAALGLSQSTVSLWREIIPARYQYQLEVITDGALRADKHLRFPANGVPAATPLPPRRKIAAPKKPRRRSRQPRAQRAEVAEVPSA